MLINRLMHRWVLMNEAGGADGGAAGSGGAVSGGSGTDGAAGAGAAAGSASGVSGAGAVSGSGNAATGATGADAAAGAVGAAAQGEAAKPGGIDAAALQPPASLVGEAKEGAEGGDAEKKDGTAEVKVDDKPVEYTDFTLPEGLSLEDESLKAFKEAAAGAKLSQDQAQAFVDMHAKALQEAATKPYELWRDTQKQWQDEIKADPEFGGAKLEKETIPAIARAIKAFSPSAEAEASLRQAFHFTGAGNHPEMIRFMARIGKSMSEGTHVAGAPSGNDGKSAAAKLYPSTQTGNGQS